MKIIYRHVIKEYLRILSIALLSFVAIYLIVDFFERLNMFVKNKAPIELMISYFLLKVPYIIFQTLPVAVLLATLLTIGIMSKNNEVTAMKSCGISVYMIAMPLILLSLLIAGFSFVTSEYITPYTNQRVAEIKNKVKGRKPKSVRNNIWYSGKDTIYNIRYYDIKTGTLNGVTVMNFDKDFNIKKRMDGKRAEFIDGKWVLKDITMWEFSNIEGVPKTVVVKLKENVMSLTETPESFKEVRKKAEEMSYSELKQFIAKLRSDGYEADEYIVDLQAKLSLPFISVIMTIIGIPFALTRQRAGSLAVGIGLSIVIGFCYWITLAFSLSLGHVGVLPPLVAAWVSLFIFLMVGGYMFSTIRQ